MQVKKKKVDDNTYESYTSQKIQTLFFFLQLILLFSKDILN